MSDRHQRHLIRMALFLVSMLAAGGCGLRAGQGGGDVLAELTEQFNRDRGVPRLVVLVSPTCTACLGGAQWIQDSVLEPHADLKIQVYAVWFSMLPTDTPAAFPDAKDLMSDPRVRHYWDSRRSVGARFKNWVPSDVKGPIEWDAFYLYSADAVWTNMPPPQLASGRTILETRRRLADAIANLTAAGER